jgi:hypothetical protein
MNGRSEDYPVIYVRQKYALPPALIVYTPPYKTLCSPYVGPDLRGSRWAVAQGSQNVRVPSNIYLSIILSYLISSNGVSLVGPTV